MTEAKETTIFYLARGPTIVCAVVISLFYAHIRESFTLSLLLHLTIASFGTFLIFYDARRFVESIIRSGLNLFLDKIVLDDLLRTVYDPINGILACTVGTYVGASSMYGLNMSEDQRTELIKSSLFLEDENQAHSVLFHPGGCKALFPTEVQKWLNASKKEKSKGNSTQLAGNLTNFVDPPPSWSMDRSADGNVLEGDKDFSDSDTADMTSSDTDALETPSHDVDERKGFSFSKRSLDSDEERTSQSFESRPQRDDTKLFDQADPLMVFFSILKKMTQSKLKSYAEAIPQSKIENVGIAAAVATFGMQLALRRSSKKTRIIQYFCASVATLSLGTIFSREALLGNLQDKEALKIVCKDLASRILKRIKEKSTNKALFAMIVLAIYSRKKRYDTSGIGAKDTFFKR